MQKAKVEAVVRMQQEIAPGIFDMWLVTELAKDARAGQFIHLFPNSKSNLLGRPISICEVNSEKTQLRIVYRVAGEGTTEFSAYREGDKVSFLGVLGNGFPVEEYYDQNVVLLGGGIGIPPMLELAKQAGGKVTALLGYRNDALFLKDEIAKYATVHVSTEDGSAGVQGNVISILQQKDIGPISVMMACGPMPMLRAVKKYAQDHGIPAYLSLEERMACGVGACLGCVVKTKKEDAHSHVHNTRICLEGPVFAAEEVEIG